MRHYGRLRFSRSRRVRPYFAAGQRGRVDISRGRSYRSKLRDHGIPGGDRVEIKRFTNNSAWATLGVVEGGTIADVMANIEQGITPDHRIGSNIYLRDLVLRGQIFPTRELYNGAQNLRLMVVWSDLNAISASDMYTTSGFTAGGVGATTPWRRWGDVHPQDDAVCLLDKLFSWDYGTITTGTSGTPTNITAAGKRNEMFEFHIPIHRVVSYLSDTGSPSRGNLYIYWVSNTAVVAPTQIYPYTISAQFDLYYQDQ